MLPRSWILFHMQRRVKEKVLSRRVAGLDLYLRKINLAAVWRMDGRG